MFSLRVLRTPRPQLYTPFPQIHTKHFTHIDLSFRAQGLGFFTLQDKACDIKTR